jgi:hypothetical protein
VDVRFLKSLLAAAPGAATSCRTAHTPATAASARAAAPMRGAGSRVAR